MHQKRGEKREKRMDLHFDFSLDQQEGFVSLKKKMEENFEVQ